MPARILIIDPNPSSRILLRTKLDPQFQDVSVTEGAHHGIAMLRVFRPHLVLLSLGNDEAQTENAIRSIRSVPAGLDVALIAIGDISQSQGKISLLRLGADAVFPSDVAQEKLAGHIHQLLRRRTNFHQSFTKVQDSLPWAMSEAKSEFSAKK